MDRNQANRSNSEQQHLVIYDGDCNFCLKCVSLLKLLDISHRLKYRNFRTEEFAKAKSNSKLLKRLEDEMLLVTPNGKQYWGFFTWREIATLLPALWIFVPFLYLPFADLVGEWAYAFVSKNRNRWGCKSCPEHKHSHSHS